MKRNNERGAALMWAIGAMTLVLCAVSVVAGALAGQANAVRRMSVEAAREDLERAGAVWAKDRLRRGAVSAPETLELVGGTLELRPASGWGAELIVQVRGEAPARPVALTR